MTAEHAGGGQVPAGPGGGAEPVAGPPVDGLDPVVLTRATDWLAGDPDPADRRLLSELVDRARAGDADAAAELVDAMSGDLSFGTAGLRGRLGPGPNRMNHAVVIRAAAALAGFLHEALAPGTAADGAGPGPARPEDAGSPARPSRPAPPHVVVGHDARHGSAGFARDTAAVLVAAGCEVTLAGGPTPTPIVAAAVRRLDADAGVVVTASHNPPADNGYKVYLGGRAAPTEGRGVQIVPPVDSEIAGRIRACPPASEVPQAAAGWRVTGDELVADYVRDTSRLAAPAGPATRDQDRPSLVATAMHGVGADVLDRLLEAAGYPRPTWVGAQRDPDPDFPTVAFPNPEVAGAMDAALDLARETAADAVVALDPDADRCAVAVPDRGTGGGWRRLTGDELGVLLADHLLSRRRRAAGSPGQEPSPEAPGRQEEPAAVATSIVSSSMLASVAAAHGVACVTTLTGFKWIARVPGLVFGYEEAIGYCVDPAVVRDKDGLATALVVAELVRAARAGGRTVVGRLDELAVQHGVHLTTQVTVRLDDSRRAGEILGQVLAAPPTTLAGHAVTEVTDLSTGPGGLPPTAGIRLRAGDGIRVVVRPSGTEPLLKSYLEVVRPVPGDEALAETRVAASSTLEALRAEVAATVA